MTVVDSVGWLAVLKGEPLAAHYRDHLLVPAEVLCPTIVVDEVCRRVEMDSGRQAAARAAAQLLETAGDSPGRGAGHGCRCGSV